MKMIKIKKMKIKYQFFNKGSQNIILHKHYKPEYILSLLQKKITKEQKQKLEF